MNNITPNPYSESAYKSAWLVAYGWLASGQVPAADRAQVAGSLLRMAKRGEWKLKAEQVEILEGMK